MARAPTRIRMIETAERLLAERGIADVSLREIAAAAGQRNHSAAQYHFGSKTGLVTAIFEHRMEPINERRLAFLAEIDDDGRSHDLRSLVESIVYPMASAIFDAGEGPSHYARFLEQLVIADPQFSVFDSLRRPEMTGLRRAVEAIERCLRDVPPLLRDERLRLLGITMVHALADHERLEARGDEGAVSTPVVVANLVDVLVGMLETPVSTDTRREMRAARRRSA